MDFTFFSHLVSMLSLPNLNLFTVLLFSVFVHGKTYSSWLIVGNIALSSPFGRHMCDQLHLAPAQKRLCQKDPRVMASVRDGAHLGIRECQYQFKWNRWNCSMVSKGPAVFGKMIQRGSKEAAFVQAITSAGVTWAVTKACSRGELDDCSCDNRKNRATNGNNSFFWGGCSDDVKYGLKFAQDFIDASETNKQDARADMNRHNNRVGRRTVKKYIRRVCKCHGPTISCPTRICWDVLDEFRLTGNHLKKLYDHAVPVTVQQNDGYFVKVNQGGDVKKRPTRKQLVYLEPSPNYCAKNPSIGSLGTSGRICNNMSAGTDGCDHLCCGRGYDTMRVTKVEQCHCKFHWCCKVVCKNCSEEVDLHRCKPEVEGETYPSIGVGLTPSSTLKVTPTPKKVKNRRRKKRRRKGKRKGRKRKHGRNRGKKTSTQVESRSKREVLYEDEVDLDKMTEFLFKSAENNLQRGKHENTKSTNHLSSINTRQNHLMDELNQDNSRLRRKRRVRDSDKLLLSRSQSLGWLNVIWKYIRGT